MSKEQNEHAFDKQEQERVYIDREAPSEEMTVDLELDEGTVTCRVITIFAVGDKDYIALLPIKGAYDASDEGNVWIYGYRENLKDPNEEPELIYIEDEEEYEAAADAFEEYLDDCEFDSL
ncbi:MAG: DUF1292 domain-containing protein [Lachnospiraceae bacterium]|nr:DUF1292 domain-containing protein [Lachnospiraceae bacterium]